MILAAAASSKAATTSNTSSKNLGATKAESVANAVAGSALSQLAATNSAILPLAATGLTATAASASNTTTTLILAAAASSETVTTSSTSSKNFAAPNATTASANAHPSNVCATDLLNLAEASSLTTVVAATTTL